MEPSHQDPRSALNELLRDRLHWRQFNEVEDPDAPQPVGPDNPWGLGLAGSVRAAVSVSEGSFVIYTTDDDSDFSVGTLAEVREWIQEHEDKLLHLTQLQIECMEYFLRQGAKIEFLGLGDRDLPGLTVTGANVHWDGPLRATVLIAVQEHGEPFQIRLENAYTAKEIAGIDETTAEPVMIDLAFMYLRSRMIAGERLRPRGVETVPLSQVELAQRFADR